MFNGKILKRIRNEENLTQEEFAGLLETVPSYISLLESGKRQPSIRFLQRVERLFHCKFKITCHRVVI